MKMRIACLDLVSNSFFPVLAAEELGFYRAEGVWMHTWRWFATLLRLQPYETAL